jgi:tetratricopeptide (TPR) repeat protein
MNLAKIIRLTAWPLLLGAAPVFALQQGQQQDSQQSPPPASQSDQTPPAQTQPATPAPETKKHTTAQDNPFPEDISRKAAQAEDSSDAGKAPTSPGKTDPSSANSDSSSSRSKFEAIPDMSDDESRISNGAGGFVLNPKLAIEDVRIGGFYLQRGDYKGAYSRYKEATQVNPENADAVFGLAEAARGLNHKDEAAQNYRIYLDAFPDGKKSKDARKALATLGAPPVAEK